MYIREAHPDDGWQMRSNVSAGIIYDDPKTLAARRVVAENCLKGLGLKLPTLLDDLDDAAMKAYNAWPNRVYVIGGDGLVAWKGKAGPMGVIGVNFEEGLKQVLRLPGQGRFTEHRPNVGLLDATRVTAEDLSAPGTMRTKRTTEEVVFYSARRGGPTFTLDPGATLAKARKTLREIGLVGRRTAGEDAVPTSLVSLRANGREGTAKRARLYRLRYEHVFRNVRLEGDRVDLVLDSIGLREVRVVWHRVAPVPSEGETKHVSSLAAAKARQMMKAVARLRYERRDASDDSRFHPVWRLVHGKKVETVDVVELSGE